MLFIHRLYILCEKQGTIDSQIANLKLVLPNEIAHSQAKIPESIDLKKVKVTWFVCILALLWSSLSSVKYYDCTTAVPGRSVQGG